MNNQDTGRHIPVELDHPFFCELVINPPFITENIVLFLHEKNYYFGVEGEWPWNEPGQAVSFLYQAWEVQQEEIARAFRNRKRESILSEMKRGIGLFLHALFWSNEQPVSLASMPEFSNLFLKPVNCGDRVKFLLDRPALFHSFIQLGQLMDEQHKHFLVNIIKNKKK